MDAAKKEKILEKNRKLINMVIERAKRDFPDDIALIGLAGSFQTGDFHEKSDLDLVIVSNTDRAWEIAECFILDDVGYDIYCTPWKPRIEDQANLESAHVSHLTGMEILYYSKEEDLKKFEEYRDKAIRGIEEPMGKAWLERARKYLDHARNHFADTILGNVIGEVRYASAKMLVNVLEALNQMNAAFYYRGIRRYLEDMLKNESLPEHFEELYMAVVCAESAEEIKEASKELLQPVFALYDELCDKYIEKPVKTADGLRGTYEELWSNCRNKILKATRDGDISYTFHAASGAQGYLDEMRELFGTAKYDIMGAFDPHCLQTLQDAFLEVMDAYRAECEETGLQIQSYSCFEDLYRDFMEN